MSEMRHAGRRVLLLLLLLLMTSVGNLRLQRGKWEERETVNTGRNNVSEQRTG